MTTTEYINYILQALEMPLWGRWQLKEQIAAFPDSALYSLESRRMNRTETAVLKIMPLVASKPYLTEEQKQSQIARAREQAEQESDLLFRLQSCPNIVTYQDEDLQEMQADGQLEGYVYLIRMEALECLTDSIRTHRFFCSEENVIRLAKDLAYALMFAHAQGITHRSIQPDEIFLSEVGTAKLGGFRPPKRSGTAPDYDAYIAPEIFMQNRSAEFTPQADLYSLGICLYQLMNRMNLPFEPESDADAALENRMRGAPLPKPIAASESFARIILKACAFSPSDRFQSAEELLGALMFPEKAAVQIESFAAASVDIPAAQTKSAVPISTVEPAVQTESPVPIQTDESTVQTESSAPIPADESPIQQDSIFPLPASVSESAQSEEIPQPTAVPEPPSRTTEPERAARAPSALASAAAEPVQPTVPEYPVWPQLVPDVPKSPAPDSEESDTASFEIRGSILFRYRGTEQRVTLPQGISVIAANAFENCETVREISIPEGVMRIEEMAFANCPNLERVLFPNSLRMIHNKAFQNCSALQSAEFHGFLSLIGTSAFDGCQSLVSVVFDCPIEKIGYDAFSGCCSLTEFRVSDYSYAYKTVDGVLFDYECKHLVCYPAGRSTPDYIIPETVFTVEDGAFYGSSHLERIKLSKNVKRIGSAAFRDCTSLREVAFSENLETIKSAAFQGCVSLTKISLPAWTTYIGTYAFSHCEQLVSVNLSAKMTELCMGVFEYCKSLTRIRLPESIIKIGDKAFMDSGLTEIFIPYSTTKIEAQSFANCTQLRSVFLSNRISQIAWNAFDGCDAALTVFGLPNSLPAEFAGQNGMAFIQMFTLTSGAGQYELHEYKGNFSHIAIPPDVNIICDRAFQGVESLESVDIPSNVGAIGSHAFDGCEHLKAVTITNLIMKIGEEAFANCLELTEFHISDFSQNYAPKVQRKIHRNFYKVLESIHPGLAEQYASQYNVTAKSTFLDMPFPWQIEKESQEHIERLAAGYECSPLANALIRLISEEADRSERRLMQIELFGDSIMITGVKAGQTSKRKTLYRDLDVGVRTLPDVNHMLACATVIVRAFGRYYTLAPVQNKDSAVIRPSLN